MASMGAFVVSLLVQISRAPRCRATCKPASLSVVASPRPRNFGGEIVSREGALGLHLSGEESF